MGTANPRRVLLDDEFPVDLEVLAVNFNLAAAAQVADEVGVDGGLVDAARLGVAAADSHVNGAAELLVEQHLAGAAIDRVVGADPELSEPTGGFVGIQRLDQALQAPVG